MKSSFRWLLLLIGSTTFIHAHAQDTWASWSHAIPVQTYRGDKFKLEAKIRTEIIDDSACAMMWARVDKAKGYGFFDNMGNRPVRSKEWKTYVIEGNIDSAATQLAFGALVLYNGKFYYDDFKLTVESKPGVWKTIYTTGFDKDMQGWGSGINTGDPSGVNNLFKASLVKDALAKNNVLLIKADGVVNYGNNKKAGNYAEVNGIKLYFEIYGSGPPLLVLHGNGGSIDNASSFYPDLIKKYKVIAIDSRGQGHSTDTDQPMNYEMMASDVNALLEQLKIDSTFIWGQSDGAILCLEMAMHYPKKVKRVLAYAPNLQPDSSAIYGWAVRLVNHTIATSKDKKEVKLYTMMRDEPNIPFEALEKITAPCLLMSGDRDAITLEHMVKMFRHIPNSQLCVLPGSTHGGAWEKKKMFMEIMDDFFNKPFKMPDTSDWWKE